MADDWDALDADAVLLCYGENCATVANVAYDCGMRATTLTQTLRSNLRPFLGTNRRYHTLCDPLLRNEGGCCICCLITHYSLQWGTRIKV